MYYGNFYKVHYIYVEIAQQSVLTIRVKSGILPYTCNPTRRLMEDGRLKPAWVVSTTKPFVL
jgi:hypothetical protein